MPFPGFIEQSLLLLGILSFGLLDDFFSFFV